MLEKKVLGNYRVLEKIGQGGMGAVYKAWDEKMKRYAALKVLTATVNETFFALFQKEIQLLSCLDHPNIVPIYDVGWYLNVPYFAMGYVEGIPLLDVIVLHQRNRRGFAMPFFHAVVRDVCQALHHAHSRDVFHRDLKPENILVTPRKRAVLLDFGLAKLLHDKRIVPPNAIVGTPQYMSPEQIRNEEVDHRSDIYSLGMLMYVCLTGRLPIMDQDAMRGARRRIKEPIKPPSSRNPGVPPGLDDLVMRCLEIEVGRRFQLVSDIQLALTRLLEEAAAPGRRLAAPPLAMEQEEDQSQAKNGQEEERAAPRAPLVFVRNPQAAAARLDQILALFRDHLTRCRELGFPYSTTLEVVPPAKARTWPKVYGQFNERSDENRFVHVVFEDRHHLFLKFSARLLKGVLEVEVAMGSGPDAPPVLRQPLDLAAWDAEGAVDWDEVFKGLLARFVAQARR